MPVVPPGSEQPLGYTVGDICLDAAIEIGISSPGDELEPDVGQWLFRKLNLLLDTWATRQNFVWAYTFNTYTLVPNLSPHTIGPAAGATFSVTQRPTRIPKANIILNNVTPAVEVALTPRDRAWWMDQSIKLLPSQQPTDYFYSPDFPNGSIYFWPVPNSAYGARLECWTTINQFVSITDPIGGPNQTVNTVPPGYRNAMMLSLAEDALPGAVKAAHPVLLRNAANARAAVFGLNTQVPNLSTRDAGVPGGRESHKETTFNYKSRSWS